MTRQYSLCGDRWDPSTYRVGVLREPAGHGGSAFVHDELAVGDVVGVAGPRNNFPLVPSESYLFVAGGIGITPLLPMIAQADLLGADWRLLYGGRRRASMAFLDELAAYGDRVQVVPQDEHGLLDLPHVPGRAAPRRPDLLLRPGAAARGHGGRLRRLAAAHPAHRAVRGRRDRGRRCAPPRSRSSSPAPARPSPSPPT